MEVKENRLHELNELINSYSLKHNQEYIGKTEEEFKHEIKLASSRNVKARVVLEKLLRTENIDITEEEIDKKMEEIAKSAGKPYEEFKKQVNNDLVNRVANELLMSKLIDFLHKNNTIK